MRAFLVGLLVAVPLLTAAPAQAAGHPAVLDKQGGVTRVLLVTSASWTSTYATATAWEKRNGAWVAVRRDMPARVGRSGFKTDRREGDGSTPAGQFFFRSAFGSQPNPGNRLPWRDLVPRSCWSGERADYNTWVHRVCTSRDEDLWAARAVAYRYAAVIGFNDRPAEWGKGSGIFLHQTTGRATAGCVALPQNDVIAMIRWLNRNAKVVMGPQSYVDSLGR